MKQLITKCTFNANYGGGTQYQSLWGSDATSSGDWAYSSTFGADSQKVPCPLAGTFSELVVITSGAHPDFTLTLNVNGTDSALSAAVASTTSGGSDVVNTATVAVGDDVQVKLVGVAGVAGTGYVINFSVLFTTSGTTDSMYGTAAQPSSITNGSTKVTSAFGHGAWAALPAGTILSNFYSIVPMDGTVSGIYLKTYAGAPGVGIWTGLMRLNGVLQDGSGGTVDTTCVLTGANPFASATFTLPVVTGTDHLEIALARTGSDAPFANAQVAVACIFTAGTADQFMWCGGNNNSISTTAVGWTWIGHQQLATPELTAQVPIGPSGLTAIGNYIELTDAPTVGNSWTFTARQSAADTTITFDIVDLATSGSATSTVNYAQGDTLDLQMTPTGATVALTQVHWGLIGSLAVAPPVPPVTQTYPLRRLRQFPLPYNMNLRAFIQKLEFICQAGVGLSAGPAASPVQGQDPVIMVQISRDGGSTYGPELWLPLGPQGEYTRRAILRRGGRYRDGVVRVTVSDPVFAILLGVDGIIEPGVN